MVELGGESEKSWVKQLFAERTLQIIRKNIRRAGTGRPTVSFGSLLCLFFPQVNRDAIFVLGNQKSGTSVISALLATYGGLSLTLDFPVSRSIVEEQDRLHQGQLTFEDFVEKHKYEFSSELVKEPALTFLYEEMSKAFSLPRVVFVIRDPRDNLRSILNRVNLRGDLEEIDDFDSVPKAWQRIIDNRWMGLEYEHYIDSMSARWNRAADVYLAHSPEMVLCRYEDFVIDKVGTIERLARQLDIPKANCISGKVDVQYQPRGDREISWEEFFGHANLRRIERICGSRMIEFGYLVKSQGE